MKNRIFTGLTLVVVGLALYALQYLDESYWPLALALVGGILIAAYFASKSYPALVFGGILAGLGMGLFGEPRWLVLREFYRDRARGRFCTHLCDPTDLRKALALVAARPDAVVFPARVSEVAWLSAVHLLF